MKPIWASEGPNMVPKWAEHRLKMAPWRLLGEPWAALGQPSGGPGAPRQILERFWVPLGTPFGASKIKKNCLGNYLNPSCIFGNLGAAGVRFGLDVGAIWGSIFGARARPAILAKNSTALQREHDFQGSGGSQKGPKMGRKTASDGSPAPKPSWGPLEPHVGSFGGPWASPNGARNRSQNRSEF